MKLQFITFSIGYLIMSLTLNEAKKIFLTGYKPTSRLTYNHDLTDFVNYIGSSKKLNRITPLHVAEYGEYLEAKNYAIHTYNKRVKSIRTFFNAMIKLGYISENPARALKTRRSRQTTNEDKAMPDADYETLLQYAIVTRDTFLTAFVLFLGDTGCRRGALHYLTWDKIKLVTQRTENMPEGFGGEAWVTEKGDDYHPVYFGEACRDALLELRKRYPNWSWTFGYIVPSGKDKGKHKPKKAEAHSLYLRRACKSAGIKGYGCHSLRYRKGHRLGKMFVELTIIQGALNHSSIMSSMPYLRKDKSSVISAVVETSAKPTPLPPITHPLPLDLDNKTAKKAKIIRFPTNKTS
jgi:integrase